MANKIEKQLVEEELILCNDICNRLINYIKNEEYEMVNAIFSFSIKEFDNLAGLLIKINKRHNSTNSINIGQILSDLVGASSFENLGYLLENELLSEFNKIKNYFELELNLDEQFKIKLKHEIKKEIIICKSYIDIIILAIDTQRYEKINSVLEKYNYRFARISFFVDLQNDKAITPDVLKKILKINKNTENFELLKSFLQANDLPEIKRIEKLLELEFIPKDEDLLSARYKENGQGALFLEKDQVEAKDILSDKLATGEYKEEYIKCNCGADDYTVISKIDRHGVPISQVICKICGLLYLNPRMNQESYDDFYDKYYRALYSSTFNPAKLKKESWMNYREDNILRLLGNILNTEKLNILEVGCGDGKVLERLKSYGHDVMGIDLDSNCVNIAKEKGLNVIHAHTTDLIEEYSSKFDLIITIHVVEHFLNTEEELGNIRKLLKPDGQFYIEVPGIKNTSYGYNFLFMFQNAHTFYFNLCTLTNVMNRNQFELVKGSEYITAVYKINENISPEIDSENYQDTLEYMKLCEDYFRIIN